MDEVKEIFREFDKDGDKSIGIEEFLVRRAVDV